MHVLNLLFLIVIINILIFSVQSYTLKKYDNGQFFVIASGPVINEKFNVPNHQVSKFLLTKDEYDSVSVQLRITSDGAPESLIFSSTFSDKTNMTYTTTPLEYSMCIPRDLSFSIKMNNYLLGGDYIISIQGTSDVSKCYEHVPVNQANQEPESIVLTSSEQLVIQSDGTLKMYVTDYDDDKNIEYQKSTASTPLVNGVLIFSTVLLFLQLII
ncbi:hypothetical protein DDB_G0279119 [Dictyostelium discoideum AX4]|uniref:Uncharacterized protein n=1 Tax=Dictyostelium discoideum TaxID=44689 RepID=Q54X91_DICDI|nr:hypothetical protein DDB_G0279119 [Dictyostelium discoideum AX4]EAL67898.1 hypothetical protein DDB_G0279119 [Dictyostelium discoideum AX4]|eukprot:XP_641876.1 hypothetical protein DDB_G0279119 [Dictyostelium discoideum AX4]